MPRLTSLCRISHIAWGVAIALGVIGCDQPAENSPPTGKTASAPLAAAGKLRLLVVDDPGLAGAIRRRSGEWQARSGGKFEVVELATADLQGQSKLEGDAVVYPAHYVGQLAARAAIVPLRSKVLENDKYDSVDVFSLVWTQQAKWGQETMALPLGSPLLTLVYRSDLLEKAGMAVPTTWQEYDRLAERFATRDGAGEEAPVGDQPWSAAVEPLGPGFAGRTLLARAACYAHNPNNYSTLFHIDTMEPLVAGAPLVRALEELLAAAKHNRAVGAAAHPAVADDPAAARQAIENGHCALALTWPTAAGSPTAAAGKYPLAFAALPGSREVFDVRINGWQPRGAADSGRVPFVGYSGRLASVTSACRNVLAAQRLIAWLSGSEISSQVSPSSPETTLFRTQHASSPTPWVGPHVNAAAAHQYAAITAAALSQKECLAVPRIPGVDEYLAALDTAVLAALGGNKTSQEALTAAATEWRAITDRLGQKSQLAAYRSSLGL